MGKAHRCARSDMYKAAWRACRDMLRRIGITTTGRCRLCGERGGHEELCELDAALAVDVDKVEWPHSRE